MEKTNQEPLLCNACGKEIGFFQKNIRNDYVIIEKSWGYASGKDGEKHHMIMCEECYSRMAEGCKIPPKVEELTELV